MPLTIKHSDIVDVNTAASEGSRSDTWEWDTCEFTLINPRGRRSC